MLIKLFLIIFTLSQLDTLLGITIIDYNFLSKNRYKLTKEYSNQHYHINHANLIQPKIVVIHYTATGSLDSSLQEFKSDTISNYRSRLASFGEVNVGTHFVVDRNGTIYSLLPTTCMGRHTIGFNHTAIGIENVAASEDDLSKKQLETNAKLIQHLLYRHPSIEYLIGHLEYMNKTLEHFHLYIQEDTDYEPSIKIDPGWNFMKALRQELKSKYKIKLKK